MCLPLARSRNCFSRVRYERWSPLVYSLALRSLIRSGAQADEGSILEAVTDFPLEG